MLTFLSVPFPKSHDFRDLLQRIPAHIKLDLDREKLVDLNRYAAEERYPGDNIPITREEVERAVETAKKVKTVVLAYLPPSD